MAELMAILVLGIVGNRCKRDAYIFRGYPGRSSLFLGGGQDGVADRAVQTMRDDFYHFHTIAKKSGTIVGCKKIADRSLFHDVAVEQIYEVLRVSEWEITPQVKSWVSGSFDGPLNSKVVEDCFKCLSDMVDGQRNLKTNPKKAFVTLVQGKVIDGLHRWPAVPYDTVQSQGRCAAVQESWFTPPLAMPGIKEMKDIQGYDTKTKWYSPGAITLSQQATDLELMKHMVANGNRGGDTAWVSTFLRCQNKVVVRRKAVGEGKPGKWHMPLLDVPDSAAFAWPLEEFKIGTVKDSFFRFCGGLRDIATLIFPVTDLDTLEAAQGTRWGGKRMT
jgi:hypothetical protein